MWSLGLILAEMYTKSTFQKAETTEEYLNFLLEVLGMPDNSILKRVARPDMLNYFDISAHFQGKKTLKSLIPQADSNAIDLISKLLTYDPNERLSAKEVLTHPFLSGFYAPEDEWIMEGTPVKEFEF